MDRAIYQYKLHRLTVTAHYINDEWQLVSRTLSTSAFDDELRHTGINIRKTVGDILESFGVEPSKIIFVTDRGSNMLAAFQNDLHLSCCDHMLNTVLTHVFDSKHLEESVPDVRALINGAKELVRHFKKAGDMTLLTKSLKQEVCTRWNSVYTLLQSVDESYVEVEHILAAKSQRFRLVATCFHF